MYTSTVDWQAGPRRTRLRLLLAVMVVATLGSLAVASPATAQEDRPDIGLQGRLVNPGDDEPVPVEGARIEVADSDGAVVGEATTDEDGRWVVEVPGPGEYTATLDATTLPEDVTLRDPEAVSNTRTLSPLQVGTVLFPLGEGSSGGGSSGFDLRLVLQLFVEGLKLGLLIAMMAIGLSLVFGTTQLVNFAHGEIVTIGAVVGYMFNVTLGLPLVVAAILAIIATGLATGLMDLAVFRPLRKRGVGLIAQLVITIGISLFLRYGTLYLFRGDPRSYDVQITQGLDIGPIVMPKNDLYAIAISIVVLVSIGLLLQRTKLGRAMRAVSDNRDLAESSGIDVQRVILMVWIVGGGLAALGGILWGVGESISWIFGFRLLLPIFAGVILGGIGTAYGALVGSLVIGVFIQMSTLVIPSELKNAAAMILLTLVLVFRPQGILGRAERIG